MENREMDQDFSLQNKTPLWRKILENSLKLGLTGGILYFLYIKGMLDFSRVRGTLSNVPLVAAILLLLSCTTFGTVIRWRMLLKGQGIHTSLWETVRLSMIGLFFNTAIPGAVSGDVVKGYYIVKQQPEKRGRIKAFTTLLLDRIVGLSGLVLVSFTAMVFNVRSLTSPDIPRSLSIFISALFFGVVLFFCFVLLESSVAKKVEMLLRKLPFGELFARFFEAVKAYETCRHYIVKGLIISVAIHCTVISAIMLLSRSLGGFEGVHTSAFYFLVPIGMLVTAIPVAPAGLGTGHYAFFFLFSTVGAKNGADLYTAYVSFQLFLSLVGGVFYIRYKHEAPAPTAPEGAPLPTV